MTTRRKTHDGWYVAATIDGGTANQQRIHLVGPFTGKRANMAAMAMVEPVRRAAVERDDPRYQRAAFGPVMVRQPIDQPFTQGRLNLSLIRLDHVIFASMRR